MRIHLVTLVGNHIDTLGPMLRHYREQGVDSFIVNVHLRDGDDPVLSQVRHVTGRFGCEIASVTIGNWVTQQEGVWRASMQRYPDDWCVLADQDELHLYPDGLRPLLEHCDRHGYDHVLGAMVDRVDREGFFAAVDADQPLWDQFPLGGFVTFPLLRGDPRKVVAAKGRVPVVRGQHAALAGTPCPLSDALIQVHHFKWTAGVVDRLRRRARQLREGGERHAGENERFVTYAEARGDRLDISDPAFMMAPCTPAFPNWLQIAEFVETHLRTSVIPRWPRPRM